MEIRARGKHQFLNDRGFTLVGVLMVLVVLSVLGVSIVAMASNTLKVSVGERDDQSVYYIAEAGLAETRFEINSIAIQAFNNVDEEYQGITDPEKKEEFLIEKSFEKRFLETAKTYIEEYITESQLNNNFEKHYDKQFDESTPPTATIKVEPDKENSYTIKSVGNLSGKSRKVSQVVTVAFGHTVETEEIGGGGSNPSENSKFKACANGYFNSASTNGTIKFDGDIILKEDSTLNLGGKEGGVGGNVYSYGNISVTNSAPITGGIYSNGFVKLLNAMKISGDVLALGNIEFNNTAEVTGNVFSESAINISNKPTIGGQLYASGPISITGTPQVMGDIVSKSNINITNWGTTANKIIAAGTVNAPDNTLIIEQNKSLSQLVEPINGFNGLGEVSQLYKDSNCTDLGDANFKPKIPDVMFQTNLTNLPDDSELIEFTNSKTEMHFNKFNYGKYDKVNIKLPDSNDDATYSLYFNSLDMNNLDIHISGNGKLNIYVKDSLSLGKVIQDKDSNGEKRSNFDTTIYYLDDNKKTPSLSNWGNCKIEANIFFKNANLTNNGCTINGNIVVLGNNTVILAGNNTTNGQIFYLPDSNLDASGLVNIKGYVIAKNMSGSGNVTISNPTVGDGSIDTDIFDKPSSSSEIKKYTAKTLLLTEQQKEE